MSQQFFVDFKGTPIEAMKNDPKLHHALQQHAIRVTRVVEKVIGRLDHLDMAIPHLIKLGYAHRLYGVPSEYLRVMGTVFILAIKPYLENHRQWNEEIQDAWQELFSHITRVMVHAHINYSPTT